MRAQNPVRIVVSEDGARATCYVNGRGAAGARIDPLRFATLTETIKTHEADGNWRGVLSAFERYTDDV